MMYVVTGVNEISSAIISKQTVTYWRNKYITITYTSMYLVCCQHIPHMCTLWYPHGVPRALLTTVVSNWSFHRHFPWLHYIPLFQHYLSVLISVSPSSLHCNLKKNFYYFFSQNITSYSSSFPLHNYIEKCSVFLSSVENLPITHSVIHLIVFLLFYSRVSVASILSFSSFHNCITKHTNHSISLIRFSYSDLRNCKICYSSYWRLSCL